METDGNQPGITSRRRAKSIYMTRHMIRSSIYTIGTLGLLCTLPWQGTSKGASVQWPRSSAAPSVWRWQCMRKHAFMCIMCNGSACAHGNAMHVHIPMAMHVHMCMCAHACMCMCVCARMCACVCMRPHVCILGEPKKSLNYN